MHIFPMSVPEEMLLGQYIPLLYHFNMLQDRSRMDAFREAIEQVVPSGGKVLELGGGTGVLSYFAAQHASQVWCVERNPALARAARGFLENNPGGHRVKVVQADALTYVPPEPVDVVICEMLHVALIREKQVDVLRAFKHGYVQAFGPRLPLFLPEASVLAVQLVEQDFCFSGYTAPVPMFQPPVVSPATRLLSEPQIYNNIFYNAAIPTDFRWDDCVTVQADGMLNALSFLTKNFLAFVLSENRAVPWMMNQLILPLPQPLKVQAGDTVDVQFAYRSGCPLESLQDSLIVQQQVRSLPFRRAA